MSAAPFRWRGPALLFDLFGTVVQFAPAVPVVESPGRRWQAAMSWLRAAASAELPAIAFEDLLASLMAVSEEIVAARPPEYREVPSAERFRRAVVRVGVDERRAPAIAARLSQAHMEHLAAQTRLPPAHLDIVRALAGRCRLALVSNFDHAATARRVLARHGLARFFDPVLISEEFGRRKPHPAIFRAALAAAGTQSAGALYVGDSIDDDVRGARNAGVRVVWLNARGATLPAGAPAPDHEIADLGELLDVVR